jgi:DHA1 family tetracycline resistance protein-like MFS transporter
MKKPLILIFLFVFIDVIGFSLILPLLPYYAETFNATTSSVGLLLAANALAQFIGAPMIGRLSDRYGRRPLLIISIAGTVISFIILGWAQSLFWIFISRILDGFLGGDISLAQAYITDVTDENNRAKGLGIIGASFGMGFIFGPALGGTLSANGNYALPAFVAAGLAFLNLVGVAIWLPESLPTHQREEHIMNPRSQFSLRALWAALHRPCVGPLLNIMLFFSLAFTIFETMFSLFSFKRLNLDARATSYILTYVGLLVVAVQAGGMGILIKRFSEKQLIFGGNLLLAMSLLGWALTTRIWWLLLVLAPLALASGSLRVSINSALTKSVYPEEVGGTLGLSAGLGSLARVISPISGAFLMENYGTAAPGLIAALLMLILVPFTWRRVLFVPDLACPQED